MDCVLQPSTFIFGYFPIEKKELTKSWEPTLSKITLGNILAVLPIIGGIIGVLRAIAGHKFYHSDKQRQSSQDIADNKAIAKALIGRGCFEAITLGCAGILALIVDIAFWALRELEVKNRANAVKDLLTGFERLLSR